MTLGSMFRRPGIILMLETREDAILPHLPPELNGNNVLFQRHNGTPMTMEDIHALSLPQLFRSLSDVDIPQIDYHGPTIVAHVNTDTLIVIINIACFFG